jgi:hypothetical protein
MVLSSQDKGLSPEKVARSSPGSREAEVVEEKREEKKQPFRLS